MTNVRMIKFTDGSEMMITLDSVATARPGPTPGTCIIVLQTGAEVPIREPLHKVATWLNGGNAPRYFPGGDPPKQGAAAPVDPVITSTPLEQLPGALRAEDVDPATLQRRVTVPPPQMSRPFVSSNE